MRIRPLLFLLPLLGACAVESSDDGATDVERGGLGKADLVGTCEHPNPKKDLCGGKGIGNCWCDEACVDFGDCCSDAEDVCGIEPEPSDGTPCGGWLGDTCADDEYCAYAPGQWCGWADASATCETKPDACIALYDPVCGCDGSTYSNSCHAAAAGTGVLHEGECETPKPEFCGGFANFPCPEGQECVDDPDDDCDPANGGADCGGICVTPEPKPEPTDCHVGGCSGELCVGEGGPDVSICIWSPWYTCLSLTSCGNFGPEGACGWEQTPEFVECLESFGL